MLFRSHLTRHAIAAPEVAAVSHADAQVAQGAGEGVTQQARSWERFEAQVCGQFANQLIDDRNDAHGHNAQAYAKAEAISVCAKSLPLYKSGKFNALAVP